VLACGRFCVLSSTRACVNAYMHTVVLLIKRACVQACMCIRIVAFMCVAGPRTSDQMLPLEQAPPFIGYRTSVRVESTAGGSRPGSDHLITVSLLII
jgi:hypothetical protein